MCTCHTPFPSLKGIFYFLLVIEILSFISRFPSPIITYIYYSIPTRVNRTGWEPARTSSGRFPTGPNSKFEFENSQKYFKVCRINGVKNFQIFIHLVYFAGIRSSTKKEKGEKLAGSTSNGRKKY
jgi:hypothetical protein